MDNTKKQDLRHSYPSPENLTTGLEMNLNNPTKNIPKQYPNLDNFVSPSEMDASSQTKRSKNSSSPERRPVDPRNYLAKPAAITKEEIRSWKKLSVEDNLRLSTIMWLRNAHAELPDTAKNVGARESLEKRLEVECKNREDRLEHENRCSMTSSASGSSLFNDVGGVSASSGMSESRTLSEIRENGTPSETSEIGFSSETNGRDTSSGTSENITPKDTSESLASRAISTGPGTPQTYDHVLTCEPSEH